MHTVPSLVGTGTAVAAAAAGLVFSQPPDATTTTTSTPNRSFSYKRRSTIDREGHHFLALGSTPPHSSRPGTSQVAAREDKLYNTPSPHHHHAHTAAAAATPSPDRLSVSRQRPIITHANSQKGHFRRLSWNRPGDSSPHPVPESHRDSISSSGSWIRRLSLLPLSQPGSERSSVGPDSPSLTFSHGSSAPILSGAGAGPAPRTLPPNKLVKRPPPAAYANYDSPVTRRRSKSHLPSLRRPATSHQRSATLQQSQSSASPPPPSLSPLHSKHSFERELPRPFEPLLEQDLDQTQSGLPSGWTSFFHSRSVRISIRSIATRATEGSGVLVKRIIPSGSQERRIYLTQARMPTGVPPRQETRHLGESPISNGSAAAFSSENPPSTPEDTPARRTRRSFSMTFSSPGNWMPPSGSLRRPKRGSETAKAGMRHMSAPDSVNKVAQDMISATDNMPALRSSNSSRPVGGASIGLQRAAQLQAGKRNMTSPLPPISRLSDFDIDLSKLEVPISPRTLVPHPIIRPHQPSGSSLASSAMAPPSLARNRRSFTLNSYDFDGRDFTSGDDDTDFKSDTIFDSIRTAGSVRIRSVETPLESMFDESPPSTGGLSKGKRLSIQEVMIRNWDGDHDRILEEDDDETALTPVRLTHRIDALQEPHTIRRDVKLVSGSSANGHYSLADMAVGRPSVDDDDDEDWARDAHDDDEDSNHMLSSRLSPPSRDNSANLRRINPNVRAALGSISGNGHLDSRISIATERPLSNLFDWSEPVAHDKMDADGQFPRPQTVHGKRGIDIRGGRAATRKGPTATHVRSQSVPVVHDQVEGTKTPTTKFGTWGLGNKGASEDWGDDFDFEEESLPAIEASGKDRSRSFVVPEPIQASQSSVKLHSGQIRELSLLVNDLKRLCRHGRDMDMLGGSHASRWKEAEGIIALASPDEDDMMDTITKTPISSPQVEIPADASDRYVDDGFDAASLARSEDTFDFADINMSRTAVVRERYSPRRRSVFSPDDDIFGGGGGGWPLSNDVPSPGRPRTPENRVIGGGGEDVTEIVRTVMDAMQEHQHRSTHMPTGAQNSKVHFDTASLKALVKRAGDLRDLLSDVVRRADVIVPSPARTVRHDGSPAFTRVFNEPPSSPSRRLPHSRSTNSVLSRASSMDTAASSTPMGKRLQLMTVS